VVLHLIESGRPHRMWLAAPSLWSAAAHATLVASLVASGPSSSDGGVLGEQKDVVFFLPLLPKAPAPTGTVDLRWDGSGSGEGPGSKATPEDPRAYAPAARDGGGRATPVQVEEGPPVDASPVFVASELDIEVERDPASAGPRYPEPLRATNTEGSVVAEWIVDTTGLADPASFRVVTSSHPLFTTAVRECLAGMKFRPAELSGQRVRQLVRQEFRFQLALPVAFGDTARAKG
jgi:hypothetical protein